MLPRDPYILLSFVNTKLRDFYEDLDDLCKSMGLEEPQLVGPLQAIGYRYDAEHNRFVRE